MVPKCYMSFAVSSALVVLLDLAGAVAVTVLCILSWQFTPIPLTYMHTRAPGETNEKFNRIMDACVTYWTLTILLAMVVLRVVIAALLFGTVKRKSALLGKLWILVKFVAFIMSLFLALAALTVGMYTRLAAVTDVIFHLVTLYHIKVVVEALTDLERQTFVEKSGRA